MSHRHSHRHMPFITLCVVLALSSFACSTMVRLPTSPHLEALTEAQVFANAPRAEWPTPAPDTPATAPMDLDCGVSPLLTNGSLYAAVDVRGRRLVGDVPPLNLALVLDRSGSMSGAPFTNMLRAAEAFVNAVRDGDRLSVVVFSDGLFEAVPPTVINATTRADTISRIRALRDGGETWLSGGLLSGYFEIFSAFSEWNINQVVLLSDGQPTKGITNSNHLFALAARAAEHGVGTTTVGFGHLHDELLMQGLADAGGGTYHYVGRAEDIPAIFEREANAILRTAVRGTWVVANIPPGLDVEDVIGWDYLVIGSELHILMGAIPIEDERYAVIKLRPRGSLPSKPLAISLWYSDIRRRGKFTQACQPAIQSTGGRESWVLGLAGRAEAAWGLAEAMAWADADREVFAISQIQHTRELLKALRAPLGPSALMAEDQMLAGAQDRLRFGVARQAAGSFMSGGVVGLLGFATHTAEKTTSAAIVSQAESAFRPLVRQGLPVMFYGRAGTRYSARGQRTFVLHEQGKSNTYKQARFDAYLMMRVRAR